MLLSVQSPLQYCASQPLDQIKVTALSAYQTRIENPSLLLTRDGGDVLSLRLLPLALELGPCRT